MRAGYGKLHGIAGSHFRGFLFPHLEDQVQDRLIGSHGFRECPPLIEREVLGALDDIERRPPVLLF